MSRRRCCCHNQDCVIETLVPLAEYDSADPITASGSTRVYYEPTLTAEQVSTLKKDGTIDRWVSRSYLLRTSIAPVVFAETILDDLTIERSRLDAIIAAGGTRGTFSSLRDRVSAHEFAIIQARNRLNDTNDPASVLRGQLSIAIASFQSHRGDLLTLANTVTTARVPLYDLHATLTDKIDSVDFGEYLTLSPEANYTDAINAIAAWIDGIIALATLDPIGDYDLAAPVIPNAALCDEVTAAVAALGAMIAEVDADCAAQSSAMASLDDDVNSAPTSDVDLVGLKIEDEYSSVEVVSQETSPVRYRCETRIKHNDVPRYAKFFSGDLAFDLIRYCVPDRTEDQDGFDTFACGASVSRRSAIGSFFFELSTLPSSFAVHRAASIELPQGPPSLTITLPTSADRWHIETTRSRCVPLPYHPQPLTIARYRVDDLTHVVEAAANQHVREIRELDFFHNGVFSKVDYRTFNDVNDLSGMIETRIASAVIVEGNDVIDLPLDESYWFAADANYFIARKYFEQENTLTCEVTPEPPDGLSFMTCDGFSPGGSFSVYASFPVRFSWSAFGVTVLDDVGPGDGDVNPFSFPSAELRVKAFSWVGLVDRETPQTLAVSYLSLLDSEDISFYTRDPGDPPGLADCAVLGFGSGTCTVSGSNRVILFGQYSRAEATIDVTWDALPEFLNPDSSP